MCTCSQSIGCMVFRRFLCEHFIGKCIFYDVLLSSQWDYYEGFQRTGSKLCLIWSADPLLKIYFACSCLWFRFTCTFAIKQQFLLGHDSVFCFFFFVSPSSLRRNLSCKCLVSHNCSALDLQNPWFTRLSTLCSFSFCFPWNSQDPLDFTVMCMNFNVYFFFNFHVFLVITVVPLILLSWGGIRILKKEQKKF